MKSISNKYNSAIITLLLAATALLQGCASSPSKLSDDGSADKIIFPDASAAWVKEAVDPNVDNLRRVAVGMTKDNIYSLLGRPHFNEGMFGVREWDYVFNFRNIDGSLEQRCQYKIIYAPDMHLRSTYWKPESCADWLKPASPPAPSVVERVVEKTVPVAGPEVIRIRIAADGVFEFDKSEIGNLRPGGIEKLNKAAEQLLSGGEITQLKIIGHTDRLGDDDYNMRLSEARANAIRQYFIGKHIPGERITTAGVGKSQPLVECRQVRRDEALIRCLEPNRRFEIEAWVVSGKTQVR